jgi:hypothetical protein
MATQNSLNNKSGGFTDTALSTGVVQTNSSGLLSSSNGTNGQVLIGGGTAPAWANLTSSGNTITITNGANTINLETTNPASGITWQTITTSSATLAPNNGYFIDYSGGTCQLALPSVAPIYTLIYIVGIFNTAGEIWQINQASGQSIGTLGSNTTTGASGYLQGQYQTTVALICTVANTTWQLLSFTPALSALTFH